MIKAILFSKEDVLNGFEISGHSTVDADDMEGKLVCSAVSSAAIMAANTITEIIGDSADISTDDGYLKLTVNNPKSCLAVLEGLKLHLSALSQEYPDKIKVIMEVEP
ncbi:MAG: ribosomal-processing cysteine protease Prp [Clostridia bacterium]|nr:ribosomal-processing cysteine protease Prp [Clostridia bacterium]